MQSLGLFRILSLMVLAVSARVEAASVTILVDGSGSMKGYHTSGALQALVGRYQRAAGGAGHQVDATAFVSDAGGRMTLRDFSTWAGSPQWGANTDLVGALKSANRAADTVVLITDNVHDPDSLGVGGVGAAVAFYDYLRTYGATHTWLNLHLLDFDGSVEISKVEGVPNDAGEVRRQIERELPNPDWKVRQVRERDRYWRVDYKGKRALAGYVFAQSAAGAKAASAISGEFGRPEDHSLLVVPMDAEVLKVESSSEFTPSSASLRCQQGPRLDAARANLVLNGAEPGAPLQLQPTPGFVYDPSSPTRFAANISYRSAQDHVQIGTVGGEAESCAQAATVRLENPRVQAQGSAKGLIRPDAVQAWVSPDNFIGDLGGGAVADGTAQMVFDVPALVGAGVPADFIANNIRVAGELVVTIPGQSFVLAPHIRSLYFTEKPTDLARLYSPIDPINYLASQNVELRLPVVIASSVFVPTIPPPEPFPWSLLMALGGVFLAGVGIVRPFGVEGRLRTRIDGGDWTATAPFRVGRVWTANTPVRVLLPSTGKIVEVSRCLALRPTIRVREPVTGALVNLRVGESGRLVSGASPVPIFIEVSS